MMERRPAHYAETKTVSAEWKAGYHYVYLITVDKMGGSYFGEDRMTGRTMRTRIQYRDLMNDELSTISDE